MFNTPIVNTTITIENSLILKDITPTIKRKNCSPIWKHAKKYLTKNGDDIWKCNFDNCNHTRKFCGTNQIKEHLKNFHKIVIRDTSEDEEINSIRNLNDDEEEEENLLECITVSNEEEKIIKSNLNEFLLKFIVSNFLPFNIINNYWFKLFVSELSNCKCKAKNYIMPCIRILSNHILNDHYDKALRKI
jgi:hypothetical protein